MEAYLSGLAETVFFSEKNRLFSIHLEKPEQRVARSSGEMIHFLRGPGRKVHLPKTTVATALEQLQQLSNEEEILDLALIPFDAELSEGLRLETLELLEEKLVSNSLHTYLENLLFSNPLPESAQEPEVTRLFSASRFPIATTLYQRLLDHQTEIRQIHHLWNSLADDLFEANPGGKAAVGFQIMQQGLFKDLALALPADRLNHFRFQALAARSEIKNYRNIITEWTNPLATPPSKKENIESITEPETDSFREPENREEPAEQLLKTINKQKNAIIQAIQSGNTRKANRYLQDLLTFHDQHGGGKFAAKSLCDLATTCQTLGRLEWELQLTEKAVAVHPQDAHAWTQRADVLVRTGRLKDALPAFSKMIQWDPTNVIGKNYRADVLNKLNRFDEALEAYENTIAKHPDNVVAKNGRADVLKNLNRLDDALRAYDKTIAEHPDNAVAKNGRADVLKNLNRLDDALLAYDKAIAEHPDDVVAKNGRADVLKNLNRLDDALMAYDKTIANHPDNVVAKAGRADVLKNLNRLDDALMAYDETIAEHPDDVVAKAGRADVLKNLNRLDDALVAYDETIAEHPDDAVAKNGRADVLKKMNRIDEALAAYEEVLKKFPEDDYARTGRGSILLLQGHIDRALAQLTLSQTPKSKSDWTNYHLCGVIHLKKGNLERAADIFSEGARNAFPLQRDYFKSGLAAVRLRQHQLQEADRVLAEVTSPALAGPVNLLKLHVSSLLGRMDRAKAAYQAVRDTLPGLCGELLLELHDRFIKRLPGRDDDFFYQKEALCLAMGV